MENKTSIVLVSLVIGLVLGYFVGANRPFDRYAYMPGGMHMLNYRYGYGGMGQMMNYMTYGLQGRTGDDFDQAFLAEMILHHEGAVQMAQAALASAKHPELKSMANAIISAQTQEIAEMKAWLKSWYNQ